MSHEAIPIEAKDAASVHVLIGVIDAISVDLSEADVAFDDYGLIENIPIFYHCENEEIANKESGQERIPFTERDEVVVINSGNAEILSASDLKIVGFADGLPRECLTERVYVAVRGGGEKQCFVWEPKDNKYAEINDDNGVLAAFPCDPASISGWKDQQVSAGENLFRSSDCGRTALLSPCGGVGIGDYGTAGSGFGSTEEASSCIDDHLDTAICDYVWDFTTKCYTRPGFEHWIWAGSSTVHRESHTLWGRDVYSGGYSTYYGSQKITFRNNSDIKSGFTVEVDITYDLSAWWADGAACGGEPCDTLRTDSETEVRAYKFNTPIADNIFVTTYESESSGDACLDTGVESQINYLAPEEMNMERKGSYTQRIITQIYTLEPRTVTRNVNCAYIYGMCFGSGCPGGCAWQDEVFTTYGLKVAAHADLCSGAAYPNGTDGVNPTGFSRNTAFEGAIVAAYDALRGVLGTPDDEVIGIRITCIIYKGA